jgi:hypothetical protein
LLRFDFFIPTQNIAIEYQGKQHYEPIEIFGGEQAFKLQQKKDDIKRKYCSKSQINLLEIPYWEFDCIDDILLKEVG